MSNVETLPVIRIESPEREHPEIQALRKEVEMLKKALKPFADLSPMHDDVTTPDMVQEARRAIKY